MIPAGAQQYGDGRCAWDGVDDCGIDCHRLCHACVGMVSKSRSETLHVWAKTRTTRLDDCATVVVSMFAMDGVDDCGSSGSVFIQC
jgi:hypothetical protein